MQPRALLRADPVPPAVGRHGCADGRRARGRRLVRVQQAEHRCAGLPRSRPPHRRRSSCRLLPPRRPRRRRQPYPSPRRRLSSRRPAPSRRAGAAPCRRRRHADEPAKSTAAAAPKARKPAPAAPVAAPPVAVAPPAPVAAGRRGRTRAHPRVRKRDAQARTSSVARAVHGRAVRQGRITRRTPNATPCGASSRSTKKSAIRRLLN